MKEMRRMADGGARFAWCMRMGIYSPARRITIYHYLYGSMGPVLAYTIH